MSIQSARRAFRALVVILLVAISPMAIPPGLSGASDAPEYNWYATHKNSPESIGFDIALLYDELAARGLLPTETYTDPDGKRVSEIMRERKHFVGKSFPLVLDRLLCQLNPSVCRLVTEPGGQTPRAVWSGKAGTTYRLPSVVFDQYQTSVVYEKRRGESVPDVVVNKLQGCESFDEACRRAVENLNRRVADPFDPAYEGRLVLPSFGVRAHVPSLERVERTPTPTSARPPNAPVSPTLERKLRDANQTGQPLDPQERSQYIQKNIPSRTPYKLQTSHGVDDFFFKSHQEHLFSLIAHPLLDGALDTQRFKNLIVVGVLDGRVDPYHCDLQTQNGDLVVENRQPTPPPTGTARDCDGIEEEPTVPDNHGTHVTGIIGARLDGRGVVGVNPLAHIVTYEVSLNPIDDVELIEKAVQAHGARVINISMSRLSDRRSDPIEGAIARQGDVLFVIAAGNDGKSMTNKCDAFPACYEYPNVLSVVALNDDAVPDVWRADADTGEGSNYGPKFDLAAPGAHILSTISNGRWGYLSGTSQAAPMVTGAASLLLMRKFTLGPEQLRERLIVSSDLFPSLAGKVRGGRLNIKRALAFDEDLIVGRTGPIKGRLIRDGDLAVITDAGRSLKIPWADIRRLVATGDGAFTILRVADRDGRQEIEPVRNVSLASPDSSVGMIAYDRPGNPRVRILVTDIADFTARLGD